MKSFFIMFLIILSFNVISFNVFADTKEEMQNKIDELQKKVDTLELEKKAHSNGVNKAYDNNFDEFYRMQENLDKIFQASFQREANQGIFVNDMSYNNNFEMKNENDKYILELDTSGLNKDKMDIKINDHFITIKGERTFENKKEGNGSYVASKSFSSFMKTIPLPVDADISKIKYDKLENKMIIILPKKNNKN